MRLDPSLRVDLDGGMKIATGEMEDQVSIYGDNQCVVQGKIYEGTNRSGRPSSGSPKDHSSEW